MINDSNAVSAPQLSSNSLASPEDSYLFGLFSSAAVLGSLAISIVLIPDDPRPAGAMFWPAVCLTLGLLLVPALRVRRAVSSIFRAENVLMGALVYWLLLDPLRSEYPLNRVTYDSVVTAMIAIAAMAVGISLGAAGKGWRPPKLIHRAIQLSFSDAGLFKAVLVLFWLVFSTSHSAADLIPWS